MNQLITNRSDHPREADKENEKEKGPNQNQNQNQIKIECRSLEMILFLSRSRPVKNRVANVLCFHLILLCFSFFLQNASIFFSK